MGSSRVAAIREIFRPWYIKVLAALAAIPTALGFYDACCNQFGFPKLPDLWILVGSFLPWWGWLLVVQAIFVFGLFEYVRRTVQVAPPSPAVVGPPVWQAPLQALEERVTAHGSFPTQLGMAVDGLTGQISAANAAQAEALKEQRRTIRAWLKALYDRDQLSNLATSIESMASRLNEMGRKGSALSPADWDEWIKFEAQWRLRVVEWLALAKLYWPRASALTPLGGRDLRGPFDFDDRQFALRDDFERFATFFIQHRRWQNTHTQVLRRVDFFAFGQQQGIGKDPNGP